MKMILFFLLLIDTWAGGGTSGVGGGGPSASLKNNIYLDRLGNGVLGKPVDIQLKDGTIVDLNDERQFNWVRKVDYWKIDNIMFDSGEIRTFDQIKRPLDNWYQSDFSDR